MNLTCQNCVSDWHICMSCSPLPVVLEHVPATVSHKLKMSFAVAGSNITTLKSGW